MTNQAHHDQQAERDDASAQKHQVIFMFPDQVNQMPHRHLQRPWQPGPETQASKERGRQIEVILDKKGADDGGQAGYTRGCIDHERRQIGPSEQSGKLREGTNAIFDERIHPASLAQSGPCRQPDKSSVYRKPVYTKSV